MTLDDTDRKLLDDIAEHGFQGLHIPEEDGLPAFTFSVGFEETLGAPEVIIFGLRRDLMHNMLWEMFHQLKAGAVLADGASWSDLLGGFDCVSRPVHPTWIPEYFGTAIWHRRYRTGRDDLTGFQLFWPGAQQGLLPWVSGCDQIVRDLQPSLYLPREICLA